jgi:hypothetical protein
VTELATERVETLEVWSTVRALAERDELRRLRQIRALRGLLRRAAELEQDAS